MSPKPDERVGSADPVGRWGLRRREMAAGERRRVFIRSLTRAIVCTVLVVIAYYTLPLATASASGIIIRMVLGVLVIGAVLVWQVRAIISSDFPWLRSVEALALAIALMVVSFATVYLSMSERDPVGFSETLDRTGALYFTMTTLATIGFGDINASSDAARVAVMIQIVFNIAVIGAAVKLIVATARYRASAEGRGGAAGERRPSC